MRYDISLIPGALPTTGENPDVCWVREKLRKLMIEKVIEKPMRSLKRIIAYQQAKFIPSGISKRITDSDISDARERPIQDFFDGQLRNAGSGCLTGICPFHDDKRASFFITIAEGKYKNKFHCYGCGEHGDSIDFIRKIHGIDFISAVRKLI